MVGPFRSLSWGRAAVAAHNTTATRRKCVENSRENARKTAVKLMENAREIWEAARRGRPVGAGAGRGKR